MAHFNGFLTQLIKGSSTGGEFAVITGVSRVSVATAVPTKMFTQPIFGVETQGISGSFAVVVVSAVGGATAVFAESADITADGSTIVGLTSPVLAGSIDVQACPRPVFVGYSTTTALSGFTSSVFMAGEY